MDKQFFVICDNIRSLENIGSIFRTSDALGVARIFLCGICGQPPQHKISKTALGAEQTVPWEYCAQTWRVVERLKKQAVFVVALEKNQSSIDYRKFKPHWPLALVVGNEVDGVTSAVLKKSDAVIHLPMAGLKESLNVAVAFGAAGYYLKSQQ